MSERIRQPEGSPEVWRDKHALAALIAQASVDAQVHVSGGKIGFEVSTIYARIPSITTVTKTIAPTERRLGEGRSWPELSRKAQKELLEVTITSILGKAESELRTRWKKRAEELIDLPR